MSYLVPQAAVDAAMATKPSIESSTDTADYSQWMLHKILEAAVPHIAVKAQYDILIEAMSRAEKECFTHHGGPTAPCTCSNFEMLCDMAGELAVRLDELEAGGTARLHHTNDTDRLHGSGDGQ